MWPSKETSRSFEQEALPHLDALYSMALKLTRNPSDAEDLVQNALLKALRFYHRYEEGTNIRAWLFKVLINLFYNDRRKERNEQKLRLQVSSLDPGAQFMSQASASGLQPEQRLLDMISEAHLREALDKLPEEFRLAVELCDLHDFSYREIAEILECPVGTVMSRLHRGRQQLKRRLYSYALEQGYIHRPAEAEQEREPAAVDLDAFRRRRA